MISSDLASIRVLVVDDTQFYRSLIRGILEECPGILVVDTAIDAFDAREKIKRYNPDVVTLDVEMPTMGGLEFLEKIMTLRPMPVIVVSTLTGAGTETTLAALERGAVDCVGKPVDNSGPDRLQSFAAELESKVRVAKIVRVRPRQVTSTPQSRTSSTHVVKDLPEVAPKLIAIGSSTGGVEALTAILTKLPAHCPPIVIAQHMPPGFTQHFAVRMTRICPFPVHEATHGMPLTPGVAVIAPGGLHMEIDRSGASLVVCLSEAAPVNRHRPSVDVLFDAVARVKGRHALGIILTGMGHDGAQGLLHMRQQGAFTLGQDQDSCIVYGMPGTATKLGAVCQEVSLDLMSQAIIDICRL